MSRQAAAFCTFLLEHLYNTLLRSCFVAFVVHSSSPNEHTIWLDMFGAHFKDKFINFKTMWFRMLLRLALAFSFALIHNHWQKTEGNFPDEQGQHKARLRSIIMYTITVQSRMMGTSIFPLSIPKPKEADIFFFFYIFIYRNWVHALFSLYPLHFLSGSFCSFFRTNNIDIIYTRK